MEIRNLITFLKITEEKSFSRTAEQLGYAQSTITMQIKQLEEELGVRLFDRIGRTVITTDKGESLKKLASSIIQIASEASHLGDTDQEITEPIRIGLTESLQNCYMPELIYQYHEKHPHSSMIVKAESISVLLNMAAHNRLDLIFICHERIRSANFITAWEQKEPVYFTASPRHPLIKKNTSVSLDEILTNTFLQTENDSSYGLALNRYLSTRGRTLSSYLDIGNPDVIIQLLKRGAGISFLPRYIIESSLQDHSLSILPYDTSSIDVWVQLLHHKDKFITSSMRSFISLTKNYCQNPDS